MKITLASFGFKHGYLAADLVWDVRFLPNPYWVPELKLLTGQEKAVARYALDNDSGQRFLALVEPLLLFLIEEYADRERDSLVVAVGCTGGKHRSVAVVERLRTILEAHGQDLVVEHRDIDKE